MKHKISFLVLALLCIAGIAGTFWAASIAEAAAAVWNSCPHGNINCAYPGDCHSYIDTNNDAICDRSQPDPEALSSSATDSSSKGGNDSTPLITSLPAASGGNNSGESAAATGSTGVAENTTTASKSSTYFLIPVLAALAALYSLTWVLSSRKIIKHILHRQIWNVVLLVSTVISALLGLFLILRLDFDIDVSLPVNMLFWHVEAGIALGIIAMFHICWHWRYFAKMWKVAGVDRCASSVATSAPGNCEKKYSPVVVKDDPYICGIIESDGWHDI